MDKHIFNEISIGSDHAGFDLKEEIKQYLSELGYSARDFGTHSTESTDYPDYARPLAEHVGSNSDFGGILICGSGNGVCMTANKSPKVRAALCWNKEIAELGRLHNNANVICLPARFVSVEVAKEMVKVFLSTNFEGGRHQRRVDKI